MPSQITSRAEKTWSVLRIVIGWVFLWSFLDKLFGLGFSTAADKSWLLGVSPTFGFLSFGAKGPFAAIFQSIAGNPIIDMFFMVGLLVAGVALMTGIGIRIGSVIGSLVLLLIFLAGFILPEHNPILDEHIIYTIALIGIFYARPGWISLRRWWISLSVVKNHPLLE